METAKSLLENQVNQKEQEKQAKVRELEDLHKSIV